LGIHLDAGERLELVQLFDDGLGCLMLNHVHRDLFARITLPVEGSGGDARGSTLIFFPRSEPIPTATSSSVPTATTLFIFMVTPSPAFFQINTSL
jgi:hypothetical protein